MKILYIGDKIIGSPKDGGDAVKKRNRDMLKQICEHVDIIEIPRINYFKHFLNVLTFRNYGHSRLLWAEIKKRIKNNYDFVFIDGSTNGVYVKALEKRGIRTIVFCHNVEYEYYKTKYRSNKNLFNYVLMQYAKYNEKLAVQRTYQLVTINKRDDEGFLKIYGRKGDYCLPITFNPLLQKPHNIKIDEPYLLFVGSNFCSNNEGICWFIENVSPKIHIRLNVVGSCCNAIKEMVDISRYSNVQLLGFVDSLDDAYRNAAGVVCPIFTGSGMKTKTIEALQYGKTIFGTSESFMGIEGDKSRIGGLCNNADDFIDVINKMTVSSYNEYSMDVFNKYYSQDVVYPKFKSYLESI